MAKFWFSRRFSCVKNWPDFSKKNSCKSIGLEEQLRLGHSFISKFPLNLVFFGQKLPNFVYPILILHNRCHAISQIISYQSNFCTPTQASCWVFWSLNRRATTDPGLKLFNSIWASELSSELINLTNLASLMFKWVLRSTLKPLRPLMISGSFSKSIFSSLLIFSKHASISISTIWPSTFNTRPVLLRSELTVR